MTTGVAVAVAALWFPPAAFAAPVIAFAVDKFVERPKKILIEQLKKGNIDALSTAEAAEFIPMAYKFLEAAKEGEYEHNLRLLASYIAGELHKEEPSARNVKRISRQIEGLSDVDLRTIALIKQVGIDDEKRVFDVDVSVRFVSASFLKEHGAGFDDLTILQIRKSLEDLSARGLLIADRASRLDKGEEYYDWDHSFIDLISKAGSILL